MARAKWAAEMARRELGGAEETETETVLAKEARRYTRSRIVGTVRQFLQVAPPSATYRRPYS